MTVYFRTLRRVTHKVEGKRLTFVPIGGRVVMSTVYGDEGNVYKNNDGYRCWIPDKLLRPETPEEAVEELLIGEW